VIISGHRQLKAEQLGPKCLLALLPLTKDRAGFTTEFRSSILPGLHGETAKFLFSLRLVGMSSNSVTEQYPVSRH
jgi:hypothetical protein